MEKINCLDKRPQLRFVALSFRQAQFHIAFVTILFNILHDPIIPMYHNTIIITTLCSFIWFYSHPAPCLYLVRSSACWLGRPDDWQGHFQATRVAANTTDPPRQPHLRPTSHGTFHFHSFAGFCHNSMDRRTLVTL